MACIKLTKDDNIKELTVNDGPKVSDKNWVAHDAITGIDQNVMYYAYDVKRVLSQAMDEGKGEIGIPVFLEIDKGGHKATVLALKKPTPDEDGFAYYDYGAAGWPPRYETVRTMYGPGRVVDYNGEIPFEV